MNWTLIAFSSSDHQNHDHYYRWVYPHQGRGWCKGQMGHRSTSWLACVSFLLDAHRYQRIPKLNRSQLWKSPKTPASGKNRPPPSVQAENQFSAPFPGKRAENCRHSFFTEKGRKIYQIPPSRKGAKKSWSEKKVGWKKSWSEKNWFKFFSVKVSKNFKGQTVRVDPHPFYNQLFVKKKIKGSTFDLRLWLCMTWNKCWPKEIFYRPTRATRPDLTYSTNPTDPTRPVPTWLIHA